MKFKELAMRQQNVTPDFYNKILDISNVEHTLEMFFVFKDKSIKRAMLHNDASKNLANSFLDILKSDINEDTEYKPIENLDETSATNEYLYFNSGNIYEDIQHLFEGVDNVDSCVDGLTNDIFGLFFRISSTDKYILLYQQCYSMSFLKKSKFMSLFSIPTQDNGRAVFKEVNMDILNISYKVDFLIDENFFLIFNLKLLESRYGYKEIIEQQAQNILNAISAMNFIENLDMIRDGLNENAKKIKNIDDKILQMCENQIDEVKNFIENHFELRKYLKFNENNQIMITNKASRDRLIKFLTHNYLHSNLTNEEFDSKSKKKLTRE